MDSQRFIQVMQSNMGKLWILELEPVEVGLLHGAIRLMLLHPEVQKNYCQAFKDLAAEIRQWCLRAFAEMGFTAEEIEVLDSEEWCDE